MLPAALFSWVANRPISVDQAMRCAKREPGRSWEALEPELNKLGEQVDHVLIVTALVVTVIHEKWFLSKVFS